MSAQTLITEHLDLWTQAVTQKSTAGRGSNGKIELTGIKKLRELILELAVRGKLVEQDSSEELASKLLERASAEKIRLAKQGEIKKRRKLPELSEMTIPFRLPSSWKWAQLEDVGHDWGQKTPSNDFSYIDVASVDNLKGVTTQPSILSAHEAPSRARKVVREGTLIYSTVRPYLQNIAVVKGEINPEPIASTAFAILHPVSGMSARFFLHYLRSPTFVQYVESVQTGIAYPAINDKQFFSGVVPIPPLKEQHRIVQKVDELMALCDRLEQHTSDQLDAHETLVDTLLGTLTQSANASELADNWARLAKHFDTLFITEQSIDKLKQTILQLAVMGRLVEQDEGDEPATDFLTQIHTRKIELANKKIIKRPRELTLLENSEHSYIAPSHWAWTSFQDVADEISTGPFGSMIHKHDYVEGGIPLINPSHMIKGHIKEDLSVSVSPAKAEELSSYRLANGDIVMARRGEVGRCAAVTDREAGWLCGTGSFVLRFHPAINRQFILLLFSTDTVRSYLTGNSVGTTMTNLNHGILKKMPVAVPPAEEQHRIVQKVDELMALGEHLKQRLNEASNTRCQLAGAVVEQAIN